MPGWRDLTEPADELIPREQTAESVTALTRRVKALLEGRIGEVRVRGEVSNLRRQSSGHSYFQLKDAGATLSCVLFRGDAARQTVELQDGCQMILGGNLSLYEARGQYQLIVRQVEDDGVGRLQRAFEALKRQLQEEGLFDAECKQPLPSLPARIAIVTSPTGAAVQDFMRILLRRHWQGRLVVVPAKVQGEGAAAEIAAGIRWADAAGAFDVIVVGRGGGSLEDLWAFNEEDTVRAVASASLPVISAVGHEIDFTLCDFAADVRAETPSGAAELLSSAYREQVERLTEAGENLCDVWEQWHRDRRRQVQGLRDRLRLLAPRAQVEQGWLRRDDLANRLRQGLDRVLTTRQRRLELVQVAWRARDPQRRVESESQHLLDLWKRLQSVSPKATLRRGFAMVRDTAGLPVARSHELKTGRSYVIELQDGQKDVTVTGGNS